MSSDFRQFGDAARLYAKYKEVVDRMQKAYQDDVTAFLDALNSRVASLVRPRELVQTTYSRTYYNWWLANWPGNDGPAVCLWLDNSLPRIVVPGVLHVTADVERKQEALGQRVASVPSKLNLPSACKLVKGEEKGVFTVIVSYGEDKDPVTCAAEPIAHLLRSIDDAIGTAAPAVLK